MLNRFEPGIVIATSTDRIVLEHSKHSPNSSAGLAAEIYTYQVLGPDRAGGTRWTDTPLELKLIAHGLTHGFDGARPIWSASTSFTSKNFRQPTGSDDRILLDVGPLGGRRVNPRYEEIRYRVSFGVNPGSCSPCWDPSTLLIARYRHEPRLGTDHPPIVDLLDLDSDGPFGQSEAIQVLLKLKCVLWRKST